MSFTFVIGCLGCLVTLGALGFACWRHWAGDGEIDLGDIRFWHVAACVGFVLLIAYLFSAESVHFLIRCELMTPTEPETIAYCMAVDAGVLY